MTVHCCPLCHRMLSFQRRAHPADCVDGHWYGCSYCGRNLCTSCGITLGRRCDRCGGTLEKDRFFAKRVITDGDWRSFLPVLDEDSGLRMNNLELIAYATPTLVDAILHAIPELAAEAFWDQVLELEVSRRLGSLDTLSFLGDGTYLLDDAWRENLARLAAGGLGGRSGFDEAAVSQRLRLAAWSECPDLAVGIPDVVVRALADGRAWLVDEALRCLAALTPTKAELLARSGGWLGDEDPRLRATGVRAIVSGSSGRAYWTRESEVEARALEVIMTALPSRTPEAIFDALSTDLRSAYYPILPVCRELGLGDALLEHFSSFLVPTHPRFAKLAHQLADVLPSEHPLLDEVARALAEGYRARSKDGRLLAILAARGDPRHADLFASVLDGPRYTGLACAGLLRIGAGLPDRLRDELRERIASDAATKQSAIFRTLRNLPDDVRREWISDDQLVEQLLAEALTVEGLAEPLDPLFAGSTRYWTALAAQRPRLLLEAQRELARGQSKALTALGRLRAEPGDGPEALLVSAFEDTRAPADLRLTSARALSKSPLALAHRERMLAVTKDARPLVRAWAFRLADDPRQWAIAEHDESEVVRELARHRARA